MNKWPRIPFLEGVLDATGGHQKTLQSDYLSAGSFPVIDQGERDIGGYTNDESRLIRPQSAVVLFGDHTRRVKYVDYPFCLGADGVKILSPRSGIDAKFLFHFLRYHPLPDAGYSRHFKFLKELEIPLPPLAEQLRIAAILDQAEVLKRQRRKTSALLAKLRGSYFAKLFTPADDSQGWRIAPLASLCRKITDGTHQSPAIQPVGRPYVTAKHLKPTGLDFWSSPWFIAERDHEQIYARCDPRPGDILYIKDGATTGIAAINDYDFPFSMLSSLALIRTDDSMIISPYLVEWLNTNSVKEHILGSLSGVAIRRLTLEKIKKILVPVPPLELQHRFADFAKHIARVEGRTGAAARGVDALFASLQHRAFNGEL